MSTELIGLRPARTSDCEPLAAIRDDAWRVAYRGLIDGIELEKLIARRSPGWWQGAIMRGVNILVLEIAGELAGYASYGTCRIPGHRGAGEIYELYLRPSHQGLGFGRMVFCAAGTELEAKKLEGLAVQVLAANEPACRFYKAIGGRLTGKSAMRTGAGKLDLSIYFWPPRTN
ncbi:GNAT family N-acetyltransferase [Roseibium litorale]|uniref:GNAT family N-acetyltransferase n=1 Tax=Roseibium litorale TaxID=2803841 RepID=A0ABR9CMP8_9HYPH|nr:GNAT family N-acetyltransferase [Roseibium litorale]MBD8892144.1 GNAT family N-acetyltransferase [Roseibium litorale]